MSRRSMDSTFPEAEDVETKEASKSGRRIIPTEKGFVNTLEIKMRLVQKESKVLKQAINNVCIAGEDKSSLGAGLAVLEEKRRTYELTVRDLEKIFSQDRWGESTETALTVQENSRNLLELASKARDNAVSELKEMDKGNRISSEASKRSTRSSKGSRRTSLSATSRTKALAEAAAAKEQAEYDLLIAHKENAKRQNEADEERNKALVQAQHDHDIAVLKAKKLTAIANAKLSAIEQSLSDEAMSQDYKLPNRSSEVDVKGNIRLADRTKTWIENQQRDVKIGGNEESNPRLQDSMASLENKHLCRDTPLRDHSPAPWGTTGVQQCVEAIAATNQKLLASLARQNLPKCDPDVFSGDVTMFHPWRNSFKSMLRDADVSPEQEINYLHKYTKGEPQRLINNFRKRHQKYPTKLLKDVWDELEKRFGNTAAITQDLLERLGETAKFGEKDRLKLQEFSDLCTDVAYQVNQLPGLACLNYRNAIYPIVQRLPAFLRTEWDKRVVDFASKHENQYPGFYIFASMIESQAKLKNHPNIVCGSNTRTIGKRNDFSALKGDIEVDHAVEKHCPYHDCIGHNLTKCKAFERKTIQERTEWIRKAGLCFRCLKDKHIARDCKAVIKCEKCGSDRHQLLLHLDKRKASDTEDNDTVKIGCTELCDGAKGGISCSKIVLMDVFLQNNPENVQRVYAVIDDQSNASMVSPGLIEKLGVEGHKQKYFLSTCSGSKETKYGLRVADLLASVNGKTVKLPPVIECDHIPQGKKEIPTPEMVKKFPHLQQIASEIPPLDPNAEVCILIGRDAPELLKVRAFKNGPKGAPWAQLLDVGWTVSGQVCLDRLGGAVHISTYRTICHKLGGNVEEFPSHKFIPCPNNFSVKEMYPKSDYTNDVFASTAHDNEPTKSVEDRRFLKIMAENIHKNEHGNWEMPLPLRSNDVHLPNNRDQAAKRLKSLLQTLKRKPRMSKDYFDFMAKMFDQGHAMALPHPTVPCHPQDNKGDMADCGKIWYLPHFGVYHPRKPDKIRVVFDSSAEFQGVSLNKELMTGPDVLNSLLGVLMRFRQNNIAVMCDIEKMFYCFYVNPVHRNLLRFLWFKDNDQTNTIVEYQMLVHLFGNACSPAIATFGLRKTAEDGEEEYGQAAKEFVCNDFYVDDGLTSRSTEDEVIDLVKRTQAMLATAHLRLHKIVSNSIAVMEALPEHDRDTSVRDLDLQKDPLPMQRTLGVSWNLEKDAFTFQVYTPEKPYTRRGVLTVVNSVYDPLGLATPVTLRGKMLLRELIIMGNKKDANHTPLGWDDALPQSLQHRWQQWRNSLNDLKDVSTPRCYHPKHFGDVKRAEIHAFSDASQNAIGTVVYLKLFNVEGETCIAFVFAQGKLAPKQPTTIPRLELCGAVLATQAVKRILMELRISIDEIFFYTDSKVVIGYIQNESKRFYVYVANRVQSIRQISKPHQWKYIDSATNPADLATRGIEARYLANSRWFKGPEFLSNAFSQTSTCKEEFLVLDGDPEIRPEIIMHNRHVQAPEELGSERFNRFSRWSTLRRAIANLIVKIKLFKTRPGSNLTGAKIDHRQDLPRRPLSVAELLRAEEILIKTVQIEEFASEIKSLQDGKTSLKTSSLYRLDPFLDRQGVLRIGGRLRRSSYSLAEKHPVILPKKHYLSKLIIIHYHEKISHQGRQITSGSIRQAGFWIVGGSRTISRILNWCVTCRKLRGKPITQIMADLPSDRTETPPPFTNVGLDVFGPWIIHTRKLRGGVKNSKRWGLVLTCLNSRAIHIEVLETMDSSSFICALRRFFAIRGPVSIIRCDCGTNFVGGKSELDRGLEELDQESIHRYVTEQKCEWLFNPPHASHFGGIWERQIGTIRRVLDAMLLKLGASQLTHEILVTLMAEVTGIVNARPIAQLLSDTDEPQPLSPSMLLTMKTKPLFPPPGVFIPQDLYSKRRWRRTQYLADQFWIRWRREYLQSLQQRSKWNKRHPNLEAGDIVLLKDETHRNQWPMGRITEAIRSDDNNVRKANVTVWRDGERRNYLRPISQLILLIKTQKSIK